MQELCYESPVAKALVFFRNIYGMVKACVGVPRSEGPIFDSMILIVFQK